MNTISVQDRAVAKDRNQTSVVRARRMQCVDTDRKAFNSRKDGVQRSELRNVIITSSLRSVGAIFPDYDVGQHIHPLKRSSDSLITSEVHLRPLLFFASWRIGGKMFHAKAPTHKEKHSLILRLTSGPTREFLISKTDRTRPAFALTNRRDVLARAGR